jgi:hypothetical protein
MPLKKHIDQINNIEVFTPNVYVTDFNVVVKVWSFIFHISNYCFSPKIELIQKIC